MAACREDEVVGLCWGQVKGLVQTPSSQQFPEPDRGVIPAAPVLPVGLYQSRHGATAATGPGHGRWKEQALLPVLVLAGLCCPAGQRAWVRAALALPWLSPSPSCAPQHRGDAGGHCMGLLGVQDACVGGCSAALAGGCAGGEGDAPLLVFPCQDPATAIPHPSSPCGAAGPARHLP